MRWRGFFGEALHSIRGNAATTLAAVVTVLIVSFLLAVTLTIGTWVYDYTNGVRDQITVKTYVADDAVYGLDGTPDVTKIGAIANHIERLPYVKSVRYVSPATALKTISPAERASVKALQVNPYPPSFWIKLTDPAKAATVATEVTAVIRSRIAMRLHA